jgi:hypothetical protein
LSVKPPTKRQQKKTKKLQVDKLLTLAVHQLLMEADKQIDVTGPIKESGWKGCAKVVLSQPFAGEYLQLRIKLL